MGGSGIWFNIPTRNERQPSRRHPQAVWSSRPGEALPSFALVGLRRRPGLGPFNEKTSDVMSHSQSNQSEARRSFTETGRFSRPARRDAGVDLRMEALTVEPIGTNDYGPCECGGNNSRCVWGFIHSSEATVASYFVHWTLHRVADHGFRTPAWSRASLGATRRKMLEFNRDRAFAMHISIR